jgi:hypothetical protein
MWQFQKLDRDEKGLDKERMRLQKESTIKAGRRAIILPNRF